VEKSCPWHDRWLQPRAVIAVAVAALALYVVMGVYTLPYLAAEADGLAMLDVRPLGYSHEEAVAYLSALSPRGKEFYLDVQHPIDTAFPPLLALAAGLAIAAFTRPDDPRAPHLPGPVRFILLFVICPLMALLDLTENRLVAALLRSDPAGVDASLTSLASAITIAKSAAVTTGLSAVLALGIAAWRRRRRG
jgi:hypothetical protein